MTWEAGIIGGIALVLTISGIYAVLAYAVARRTKEIGIRVFRAINKAGRVWGDGMSPKVLWDVVRAAPARVGCKQKLRIAVNDRLGIEPHAA